MCNCLEDSLMTGEGETTAQRVTNPLGESKPISEALGKLVTQCSQVLQ